MKELTSIEWVLHNDVSNNVILNCYRFVWCKNGSKNETNLSKVGRLCEVTFKGEEGQMEDEIKKMEVRDQQGLVKIKNEAIEGLWNGCW